jgi:hypothetical protein
MIERHIEERGLLNASHFAFRVRHNKTLQCMRLTDLVTLNLKNNISTVTVILDIEKAFETTWQLGFPCKSSK